MYKWKEVLKSVFFLIVLVFLISVSWSNYWPHFFGLIAGLILFFKTTFWWKISLGEIFDIPQHSFRSWIFSFFWTLVNWGFFVGIFVSVGFLNFVTGPIALFLSGLVALLFYNRNFIREVRTTETEVKEERALDKILVLVYLVLFFVGLNILIHSQTGSNILSPWQIIRNNYLLVYFLLTVVLLRILFSELSAKAVLVLVVFHTFLTVSYLAFSHELFWGADIWRHLATQNSFLQTGGWNEVLVSGTKNVFDFGKLSYAQFLATGIVLNKIFGLDLILINKWLQPILWAFVFPALLFSFVRETGGEKRLGLLAAIFALLPFALQVTGAFTLPVNFGFLVWLFLVWLLFKYFRERLPEQLLFLVFFGTFLIFGYVLYFILFWLLWLILEVLCFANNFSRSKKFVISLLLFLLVAFLIPTLELLFNFSHWPAVLGWQQSIKQIVGNFSGWYLAFGPRTHDIAAGNILFNQTPISSFVPNFLTVDLFWIIPVAFVFWSSSFFGIMRTLRRKDFRLKTLIIFFLGLLASYFLSRYILIGEQILSRRLEAVLAFLVVFFGAYFWYDIFSNKRDFFIRFRRFFLVTIVFLSAGAITASYSFGPDTKTVSANEYRAMQYIWQQMATEDKPCVIGETYPLLALEAITAKNIVGGGFPINVDFSQPERELLLSKLSINTVEEVLGGAKNITKANRCWLVVNGTTREVRYDRQNLQKIINDILILSF